MRVTINVTYDGTNYNGWQIQPDKNTIQGTLKDALSSLLKCPITIIGSGRTDAGVHAKGQVAHFDYEGSFPIERLHVIGGGSQNRYLMQYTADALEMPVICGPVEGTALGNVLVQLKAAGMVSTLPQMRAISAASVELKTYLPQK